MRKWGFKKEMGGCRCMWVGSCDVLWWAYFINLVIWYLKNPGGTMSGCLSQAAMLYCSQCSWIRRNASAQQPVPFYMPFDLEVDMTRVYTLPLYGAFVLIQWHWVLKHLNLIPVPAILWAISARPIDTMTMFSKRGKGRGQNRGQVNDTYWHTDKTEQCVLLNCFT